MNKSELLNGLNERNEQWEALLEQIGPTRMEQPGVNGDWTMKDVVAHLTGWQPKLIAGLQAGQRGQPEPPPPWPVHFETENEINAWIYEANHGRSLQDVLDDSRTTFQQLLAAVEGLGEEARIDGHMHQGREYLIVWFGDKNYVASEFFDHFHNDHETNVRAWLAQVDN